MKDLKVIFMGTPDFSTPLLEWLIANTNVIGVVTKPDVKVGRDQVLMEPPIKKLAKKYNIKVMQPVNIKVEYADILSLKPDIIITCAYGLMIPNAVLEYPKYGCINVHASLLPRLRGGAPIHHAIIDGFFKTGITIMHMASRMDAGDIIHQDEIPIDNLDTAGTLHNKLSILAVKSLETALPNIINGTATRIRQDETDATYGLNITREDEHIRFNTSARNIYNRIRGLNPWPGGYVILNNKEYKIWESRINYNSHYDKIPGEIVKIYEDGIGVKAEDGEIVITRIQPQGKKPMDVKDYLNGVQEPEKLVGKVFM